jgi:hypothetical protein
MKKKKKKKKKLRLPGDEVVAGHPQLYLHLHSTQMPHLSTRLPSPRTRQSMPKRRLSAPRGGHVAANARRWSGPLLRLLWSIPPRSIEMQSLKGFLEVGNVALMLPCGRLLYAARILVLVLAREHLNA